MTERASLLTDHTPGWQTVHCTSGGAMRSIEDIQAEVQGIVLGQLK